MIFVPYVLLSTCTMHLISFALLRMAVMFTLLCFFPTLPSEDAIEWQRQQVARADAEGFCRQLILQMIGVAATLSRPSRRHPDRPLGTVGGGRVQGGTFHAPCCKLVCKTIPWKFRIARSTVPYQFGGKSSVLSWMQFHFLCRSSPHPYSGLETAIPCSNFTFCRAWPLNSPSFPERPDHQRE